MEREGCACVGWRGGGMEKESKGGRGREVGKLEKHLREKAEGGAI